MGDFVRAVSDGVSGLVGGSIDALVVAFNSIAGALQSMLPGPLLPIAVVVVVLVLWRFLRR